MRRTTSKFLRDLWSGIKGCIKRYAWPAAKALSEQILPIFVKTLTEYILRHFLP
jgi:hypothetical protein